MQNELEILRSCPLFQGIEAENLREMLACLNAKRIFKAKNEAVFQEGDPADCVGVVLSGALQIEKIDFYGNRSIVDRIAPAQIFGESFAFSGVEAMPVRCVAIESSEILILECSRIVHTCCNACAFHSRMILNLLRVVAAKNLAFNQKIAILSRRTTREKLMTYLLDQAKRCGSASFTIPFDRQGLADYLGVERSALSAEIGRLRADGVLKSDRSRFDLHPEAWNG